MYGKDTAVRAASSPNSEIALLQVFGINACHDIEQGTI